MQNPENDGQFSNPASIETPKPSKREGRSSLNILPSEMKDYLNALIKQGLGERMIRKAMLQQFPDKTDLVDKSENCYRHYMNLQKQNNSTSMSNRSNSIATQPAGAGNDSEENQHQSLMKLAAHCDDRINRLQEKLAVNDDPNLESALFKAIQTKKQILEMAMEYKDDFKQKSDQEFIQEISDYTQILLVAVFNVYRMINGKTNLDEFQAKLVEFLQDTFKHYRVAKLELHRKDTAN